MYERGIGVVKDEKEAVLWYGKAAGDLTTDIHHERVLGK